MFFSSSVNTCELTPAGIVVMSINIPKSDIFTTRLQTIFKSLKTKFSTTATSVIYEYSTRYVVS